MKIIEARPFAWEFTCKSCGSELVGESDDVKMGDFGSYDGSEYRLYVVCPICGRNEIIPWNKVPPNVESAARAKFNQRGSGHSA